MEWAVLDWNEPAIEFYKSLGADAGRHCAAGANLRRRYFFISAFTAAVRPAVSPATRLTTSISPTNGERV
jgi:hypothetical protein